METAKLTNAQASETIKLIQEYFFKGGVGFDNDKLESMLNALIEADQIIIGGDNE